jgi:hypothetical protein
LKSYEEIMEILEAFDLTCSYRAAGELAGCSHHTVEYYVGLRDAGLLPVALTPVERVKLIDPFLDKLEEWVERSHGKVRGDVVFDKLQPLGYIGSNRSVRRALARVKVNYRAGRRRVYRPWITEPGMWAQWDWGHGPKVAGRQTQLFCVWLAWSRFRVIIPTWDKTLPTVIGCLDRAMRAFGGCPTYWLTDNERTVSTDHVAGIAVRHPLIVAAGHHYGVTIATCIPADPESKGGVESTVRVAKADLVPTDANLLDEYGSWAELVEACDVFMVKVNGREHRITRRLPVEMLAEEQQRLHRLPVTAFTAAFGETRKVSSTSMISFGGVSYSVPHQLIDAEVWVRVDGDEIVVTHLSGKGAGEVARHRCSTPGNPRIDDSHYPTRPTGALNRQPKASNTAEAEFLVLGDGARLWLIEAAAAGTSRIKAKMGDAVTLARLHGTEQVDWALGHAATFQRFAEGDVASILAAHPAGEQHRASEGHSMQPSTKAWEGFGGDPS